MIAKELNRVNGTDFLRPDPKAATTTGRLSEDIAKTQTAPTLPGILSDDQEAEYTKKLRRLKEIDGYWFEAGRLLLEIRDGRLYRGQYPDFETFCRSELGMGKSNMNRQLQTTKVAQLLATNVAKPEREAHVRPLLQLDDPKEQIEAFRNAFAQAQQDKKPLTAVLVARAVREMRTAQGIPQQDSPPNLSKSGLITQISRAVIRDLEGLSIAQLEAFEKACLSFKSEWLDAQLPEPPADEPSETK
jgi:hypothetical protein